MNQSPTAVIDLESLLRGGIDTELIHVQRD
jgi:hypothetical protein